MTILDAVNRRRSQSKVTEAAPSHAELVTLIAAAGTVADHSGLRPWRLIELRGDARARLGRAFAEASDASHKDAAKLADKAMRAPLLIAIVVTFHPSHKVADWEQEAVASGVAHTLSLLLDDAGWGVMWRTGHLTRSLPVRVMHDLADNEQLLGWLYVGGLADRSKSENRKSVPVGRHLTTLE